MSPIDDQLNRLFRAAGRMDSQPISAPAYGLETRVMAAWRAGQGVPAAFWDVSLLFRGLIVASAIMVMSFWPALKSTETPANPFADYLQLTDSTIPADDAP
jgi:hypothetical protein